MTEEIWRDIPTSRGYYQVSNLGEVRSYRFGAWNIMKPSSHRKNGYQNITIAGKSMAVHRLVATAFIPNPEGKPCVNHIDCNKVNNRVDNLEWCTFLENSNHASEHGRLVKSDAARAKVSAALKGKPKSPEAVAKSAAAHRGAKPHWMGRTASAETRAKQSAAHMGKTKGAANGWARTVVCIETGTVYGSISEAAEDTGASAISACCRGIINTSGGYHWKYARENDI